MFKKIMMVVVVLLLILTKVSLVTNLLHWFQFFVDNGAESCYC